MTRALRSGLTLVVFGPAMVAVTTLLVAVDIVTAFRDLAASDRAGAW